LMKLTPGLNFINVRKNDSQVISLFTLSESTIVKAESKYVGEIERRFQLHQPSVPIKFDGHS